MTYGMPRTRHATLRPVSETAVNGPQELIVALLSEPDFRNVADIARDSGWNYQRLQRWYKGSVGGIAPDDLADLLIDLGREPDHYGVTPSLAWRRKHAEDIAARAAADPDAMPAWFAQWSEQLDERLRRIEVAVGVPPLEM